MIPDSSNKYYPYKKARLIHYDYSSVKHWYIDFSAYNMLNGKLKRKRISEFNKIADIKKRRVFAERLVKEINNNLEKGYHFNDIKYNSERENELFGTNNELITIKKAFEKGLLILKNRLSKASYNSYNSVSNHFINYCKNNNILYENVEYLSNTIAFNYLDHCINIENLKGKTINKNVSILKSIFNNLVEREVITNNIFLKIKKQKEIVTNINIAYSKSQIKTIKKELIKKDVLLWNFCQFIFYSFMRPNEIRQLTYDNIDLENNYIYLSAEKSKTKKERYVYINKEFKKLLLILQEQHYTKSDLLFTLNDNDKRKMIGKNTLMSRYRIILNDLEFESIYTLYSWKHTGNVFAYKKGIDIYSLMRQNGHTDVNTTMKYLKSLGLIMDNELLSKFDEVKI